MLAKRIFDLTTAALGLLALSPLVLVLSIAIRIDSPGSSIFVQERVGRSRNIFRCYKFRTMRAESPNVPSHESSTSQITLLGHYLRRFKLDEIPQLWNVIRGEMSLVGPRPCLPSQAELIDEREARKVFTFRPGITGLGQIRKVDMSTPILLAEIDHEYILKWSFKRDIELILLTIMSSRGIGDSIR